MENYYNNYKRLFIAARDLSRKMVETENETNDYSHLDKAWIKLTEAICQSEKDIKE